MDIFILKVSFSVFILSLIFFHYSIFMHYLNQYHEFPGANQHNITEQPGEGEGCEYYLHFNIFTCVVYSILALC